MAPSGSLQWPGRVRGRPEEVKHFEFITKEMIPVFEYKDYPGFSVMDLPPVQTDPLGLIIAIERLRGLFRGLDFPADLAKHYWVSSGENPYTMPKSRIGKALSTVPTTSYYYTDDFDRWLLRNNVRPALTEREILDGEREEVKRLRAETEKKVIVSHFIWPAEHYRIAQSYVFARACDIAWYGKEIADVTYPQPAIGLTPSSRIAQVISGMADRLLDAWRREEEEAEKGRQARWDAIGEQAFQEMRDEWKAHRERWIGGGFSMDPHQFRDYANAYQYQPPSAETPMWVGGKMLVQCTQIPNMLPPRVLGELSEVVKDKCREELRSVDGTANWNYDTGLTALEQFVYFCRLLSLPENHIRVRSGQFVEKPAGVRSVREMEAEKAQELSNLPPRLAYVKLMQEDDGGQTVLKRKLRTSELTPERSSVQEICKLVRENTIELGLLRDRHLVDREMQLRRDQWRRSTQVEAKELRERNAAKNNQEGPPPAWDY